MPVCNVRDSSGDTMELYVMESKPQYFAVSAFDHDWVDNIPNYPLRDDDVMLCSYTKSGCHWVWEMGRLLLDGRTKVVGTEKEASMLEANRLLADIEDAPSPRILNTHMFFDHLPNDVLKKGNKVIFVYRNPKDVAVSMFHHHMRIKEYNYTGTNFSSYLHRFVDGLVDNNCIFDYLRAWEQALADHPEMDICFLCYEDLHENTLAEVKRLSKFLGKDYDDEFLQAVIKAASFDNMKKEKMSTFQDDGGHIMYRKGKVGDWKNNFTVAQSEWFDHMTRSRMLGSKLFKFRYDL